MVICSTDLSDICVHYGILTLDGQFSSSCQVDLFVVVLPANGNQSCLKAIVGIPVGSSQWKEGLGLAFGLIELGKKWTKQLVRACFKEGKWQGNFAQEAFCSQLKV